MLTVPNKTIYVSDGDLPLYQRAQELAGDNLSAAIAAALRRYVDVEEGRREGFDEIIVRVGPGKGRKVRFTGVLLGEWLNTSSSRVETFRVYRGRTGKFVLHIERSPDFTMVDAEGKPAGWRGYLGIGNISYGSIARRVDPRGRRDARRAPRADPAAALRHGRRLGPAARGRRPRHLTSPSRRSPGRCGMTATESASGHPRRRAAQVVRQAGRPRRHRPRGRRRHGLRAARTEWRRQDDHGPHPVDADRRRRRRGPGRRPRHRPRAGRGPRASIGLTGQFSAVDGLFTGEENLQLMADLRHLGKRGGPPARRRAARAVRPRRRGRRSRSRPTRAACGGASTWR